ncbi:MAG: HAD-IIA family hydrolase [Chitinivibrionales bacterium]|nr:HAD-IIA family hydrolase [Chitinivibrionales bacterium]
MHQSQKEPLQKIIPRKELFLLDLDGTTYIENRLIPGALDFLNKITAQNKQYIFLTNNSSKSNSDYVRKINNLGISAGPDNVFTSGQATAVYVTGKKTKPAIYCVGTQSLKEELESYGITILESDIDNADFLVIGFDMELEYHKLEKACYLLSIGKPYIATHPDLVCPVKDNRFIPDCGSFCQMLENATGRTPTYIGKPDKKMITLLCEQRGISLEKAVMIGDRLYTDIAVGLNAGVTTFCVLSGESTMEDIRKSEFQPDFVIESIAELNRYLQDDLE